MINPLIRGSKYEPWIGNDCQHTGEIGPGRTGLRLSPVTPANDAKQDVIEGATGGARDIAPFDYAALRGRYKSNNEQGAWIVNNGYTRVMAMDAVAAGAADIRRASTLYASPRAGQLTGMFLHCVSNDGCSPDLH